MEKICLDCKGIRRLAQPNLENIGRRYDHLFKEELGQLKGAKAKIRIDPSIKPVFCRAWSVPYAMKRKIEKELERLESEGTIEVVQYSEWVTPRYRLGNLMEVFDSVETINGPGIKLPVWTPNPIPKIEELHNKLAGGKTFTELDFSLAYEQMVLDEEFHPQLVFFKERLKTYGMEFPILEPFSTTFWLPGKQKKSIFETSKK